MKNFLSIAFLFLFLPALFTSCAPKEDEYSDDRNFFQISLGGRNIKAPGENEDDYHFTSSRILGSGSIDGKTKLGFTTSCYPDFDVEERFEITVVTLADTNLLSHSSANGSYFTQENNFRNLFRVGTQVFATDEDTTSGFIFSYIDQNGNEWSTPESRNGKQKPGDPQDFDTFNMEITEIIELQDEGGPLSLWITFEFDCVVLNWGGKSHKVENGKFKGRFVRANVQ